MDKLNLSDVIDDKYTKLDYIDDDCLRALFSKQGFNTYYDSEALCQLVIIFENFQPLLKIFNNNVTISLKTGVFNPEICDSKLLNSFEKISLQNHDYHYINQKINVYEMAVSDYASIYHILTSVGITSIRSRDIYSVSVLNPEYDLDNHFIVTIKTFSSDVIQINFTTNAIQER